MANALFDKGREAFLTGKVRWLDDTIRAAMVSSKPNPSSDATLSDLKVVAVSDPLTGKTADKGAAGAASTLFQGVSGPSVEAIVLFCDSGSPSTSCLLASFDEMGAVKFPFTPNGGTIQINWPSGKDRIFRL